MLRQLILQWRTARYLKVSQLYFYFVRRLLPFRPVKVRDAPPVRQPILASFPCPIAGIYLGDFTFRFLNVAVKIDDGQNDLDWDTKAQQRLWRYNLHYFDYLRESERPTCNKDWLIQSWLDNNPQGSQPGWEPYTVSLRIVNWLFYLWQRPIADIPPAWLDSLFLQACWLDRNDERHILANHYFENLKALYFAGCFFDGDHATRWRRRAQKEIKTQLHEQTLKDGGHYERSHQYHCRMLENYLDILNLSHARPEPGATEFVAEIRATAERGLSYLSDTLFPDGTIPLFNDCVSNIPVPPSELFAYARRLDLHVNDRRREKVGLISFPDSGLYGFRAGNDMFLIDCGDIGPEHQPGHTHCDFLSYELMIANRRIIVDTGVCEYEAGDLRDYVRSTKAHNTIVVDGGEQSEIWGEFRVARRAKKIAAAIRKSRNTVKFTGAFRGFYHVRKMIEHQRTVTVALRPEGKMLERFSVTDLVNGQGHHVAESYVHFHPDLTLERSPSGEFEIFDGSSRVAVIHHPREQEARLESSFHCPDFGKQLPNQVLILQVCGTLPLTLRYEIEILPRTDLHNPPGCS